MAFLSPQGEPVALLRTILAAALAIVTTSLGVGRAAGEEAARTNAGTAFAISPGVWVTARHVVERCGRVAVMVAPGRGVEGRVRIDEAGDVAVLETEGGPAGLPLELDTALRPGVRAYHPGYPQGRGGEVATRLIGRRTLIVPAGGGEELRTQAVLAWRQLGRSGGKAGRLDGLSGAPAMNARGRVVGLTLAQSRASHRLYTLSPQSLAEALERLDARPDAPAALAAPITPRAAHRAAQALRRSLQVAQVRCLR